MFPAAQIVAAVVAGFLSDPGMALFDGLGLSFSDAYPPQELLAKLRTIAECGEEMPGSTACRATERVGEIEATTLFTVATGTHEAFVESVNFVVPHAPPGLADLLARRLAARHDPIERGDREWCGGDHLITVTGGDAVSVTYWNLFKRDLSLCARGRVVKMIPYVIPGGTSKVPVFFGLGREVRWDVDADDFHERNPEYDTWTSVRGKGRGLTAEVDVMLRDAEVTWFFGTTADTLSEVRILWRGVGRQFKDRVIDQLKEIFRYHASFEKEEDFIVRGRLCKEDLHVMIDDSKDGFAVSMQNNPDAFCVD